MFCFHESHKSEKSIWKWITEDGAESVSCRNTVNKPPCPWSQGGQSRQGQLIRLKDRDNHEPATDVGRTGGLFGAGGQQQDGQQQGGLNNVFGGALPGGMIAGPAPIGRGL
jgi:hypothetical protein